MKHTDPRYGYVTCPRAKKLFEGLLAVIDGYLDTEVALQDALDPEVEPTNNGADYLAEVVASLKEGLGE